MLAWFGNIPDDALHLSVLSLGEIRKGVENLAPSSRREALRVWLERELTDWFGDRILPVDRGVADQWGVIPYERGWGASASDAAREPILWRISDAIIKWRDP